MSRRRRERQAVLLKAESPSLQPTRHSKLNPMGKALPFGLRTTPYLRRSTQIYHDRHRHPKRDLCHLLDRPS